MAFHFFATKRASCSGQYNPTEALFTLNTNIAYFLRADLAMRGVAISILMRTRTAFLSSFFAFFWDMRP